MTAEEKFVNLTDGDTLERLAVLPGKPVSGSPFYFFGIIVATKPKGTSAEMSAVLDWEIELLDALPDIKAHAKEKGVNLIAINSLYIIKQI